MEFTLELAAGLPMTGCLRPLQSCSKNLISRYLISLPRWNRGSALQVRHSSYLRLPALR
jgi:hypothetical protein